MYQDRGGGREGKGKSLRKNKQVLHDIVVNKPMKNAPPKPTTSVPAPILAQMDVPTRVIDAGCRLANRQFDRDLQRVVQRATDTAVQAMIVLNSDFEKQSSVLELCKTYSGVLYAAVGIHPDNVKRLNDRLQAQQLDQLRDFALSSEAAAIMCGLDFTREFSTRFAQEKLVESHLQLANDIGLPVILLQMSAQERLGELLASHADLLTHGAMVMGFNGTEAELQLCNDLGLYIGFSAVQLCSEEAEVAASAANLVRLVPRERLMLVSDAPFGTPQTIPDAYVRTQRNEPSNLPYVIEAVCAALQLPNQAVCEMFHANAKRFFALRERQDVPESELQAAAELTSAPVPAAAADSEGAAKAVDTAGSADDAGADAKETGDLESTAATTASAVAATAGAAAAADTEMKYACKACRRELFVQSDILPHRGERDVCKMLYIRAQQWMGTTVCSAATEGRAMENKLCCPQCEAKIGRYTTGLPMACACGTVQPAPAFRIVRSRMDRLVAGVVSAAADGLDSDTDSDSDDMTTQKRRKGRRKQQRSKHAGNFSQFRNKST